MDDGEEVKLARRVFDSDGVPSERLTEATEVNVSLIRSWMAVALRLSWERGRLARHGVKSSNTTGQAISWRGKDSPSTSTPWKSSSMSTSATSSIG